MTSCMSSKRSDQLSYAFKFLVELTGLAPVYQHKPTKLSPYTVYFCRHTMKKANKLTVSRHLEFRLLSVRQPTTTYLRNLTRITWPRNRAKVHALGLNYAAYAIPKERLVLLLAVNLGLPFNADALRYAYLAHIMPGESKNSPITQLA